MNNQFASPYDDEAFDHDLWLEADDDAEFLKLDWYDENAHYIESQQDRLNWNIRDHFQPDIRCGYCGAPEGHCRVTCSRGV